MLTLFGLVGFANMFPHSISVSSGTRSLTSQLERDLIWVIEPDSPRGYYTLARIIKLHYGQDGCARSALVQTATRENTQPTVELAPVLPSSWGRML